LYYPVIQTEPVSTYAGDSRDLHALYGTYYAYHDLFERPEEVSYAGKYGPEAIQELDSHVVELATEWIRKHGRARIDPAWLEWNHGTVKSLATAIQKESAFDRLPVLADALQEAGCQNEDILSYCHFPGKHLHYCWVVDFIGHHGPDVGPSSMESR
jgi:hypothetical protein